MTWGCGGEGVGAAGLGWGGGVVYPVYHTKQTAIGFGRRKGRRCFSESRQGFASHCMDTRHGRMVGVGGGGLGEVRGEGRGKGWWRCSVNMNIRNVMVHAISLHVTPWHL